MRPAAPGKRPRVLLVDDEPHVLDGLRLHLERRFDLVTATSGAAGLVEIDDGAPFAVIMSDMRMPGIDGADFLAMARERSPASVRMLLTGHADFTSALDAVNRGQIFRFLVKPCPPETILESVRAAAEQYRLVEAERVLLEETLTGAVRALSDTLALASPAAFGRAVRVHRTVQALLSKLGKGGWAIGVAAQLSQLGLVHLAPELAERIHKGRPLSPADEEQVERAAEAADKVLANIPRLEPVREILAGLHGGRPPKGDEAVLGAKLLRLAIALDALEAGGLHPSAAVDVLRARPDGHDAALVDALGAVVDVLTLAHVIELPVVKLASGMVLAEDVLSTSGVLLVSRGYVVSEGLLAKLRAMGGQVAHPIKVQAASMPA